MGEIEPTLHQLVRGPTFGTSGGTNRLYALNNRLYALNNFQEHENSSDVVTGMIEFTIYALLDLGATLSF